MPRARGISSFLIIVILLFVIVAIGFMFAAYMYSYVRFVESGVGLVRVYPSATYYYSNGTLVAYVYNDGGIADRIIRVYVNFNATDYDCTLIKPPDGVVAAKSTTLLLAQCPLRLPDNTIIAIAIVFQNAGPREVKVSVYPS